MEERLGEVFSKLRTLHEKMQRVKENNPDLEEVVNRLLTVHLERLSSFTDSASNVLDAGSNMSRDRLISLLCFMIVAQQNH